MIGFLVVRSPGEALDDLAALFSVYFSPGEIAPRAAPGSGARSDRRPAAAARALVGALPARPRLRRRHRRRRDQPGPGRRRPPPAAAKEAVGPGADAPTRRRDDDEDAVGGGHRAGRAVLHQPAGGRAGARRGALDRRRPRGLRAASPAAAWRRRRPTPRELWSCGRRVVAPAGHRHRRARAGVRRCRWRRSARCSATARRPPSRRCCCSPCRSALWGAWRMLRVVGRLVDPGGSPRWLVALGAVTYALVPVTSGALGDGRLGVVVGRGARCRGWPTPPSASPTPSPTGAGARPGAPGCCSPWLRRSSRSPGSSPWCSPSSSRVAGARRHPQPAARPQVWGPPLVALGVARCCSPRGGCPRSSTARARCC